MKLRNKIFPIAIIIDAVFRMAAFIIKEVKERKGEQK